MRLFKPLRSAVCVRLSHFRHTPSRPPPLRKISWIKIIAAHRAPMYRPATPVLPAVSTKVRVRGSHPWMRNGGVCPQQARVSIEFTLSGQGGDRVAWRLRIGDDVFRRRRRREPQNARSGRRARDIARGGGDDAGGRTMMTWRRSAWPTVAISVRPIGHLTTKRSSDLSFSCKQQGRPSGGTVAGTRPHAAAPPGA